MSRQGTVPSLQRVERAPSTSHSGHVQSSLTIAGGRRTPGGPGGGGGGWLMRGGQTRTQDSWNPRSQASQTMVAPGISGRLQDGHRSGGWPGCPQPASPGCCAGCGTPADDPVAAARALAAATLSVSAWWNLRAISRASCARSSWAWALAGGGGGCTGAGGGGGGGGRGGG
jgi:hypothetical protein